MVCKVCGKVFDVDWRKDPYQKRHSPCEFCGPGCSHARVQSPEANARRSRLLQKREKRYCSCGQALPFSTKGNLCRRCRKEQTGRGADPQAQTDRQRALRRERKAVLVAALGGKCVKCGYSGCAEVFDFHHIDPKQKSFALSTRQRGSLDDLLREVSKCMLLCANCHRELHANLRTSESQARS